MQCVLSTREQTLKSLDRLPKFSPMMAQLLARFTQRNCDAKALADVVAKDALLSGQVLRLANSASLGRKHSIHTVQHAIAVIGVGPMRRFALGTSLTNLFSRTKTAAGFSVTRFNLHSVATATLVELIADELPVRDGENAFISGLLHDVGKMLIAISLHKEFESVLGYASVTRKPMLDCERHILGTDHAELSGIAIARWDLPQPVQAAAFYHHEPERARRLEDASGKIGLCNVVNKADAFINYLGMSVLPPTAPPAIPPNLEFEGHAYNVDRLLQRFQLEWKRLGDLFR
jgi:HD-like signal output (HDOD) protein